MENLIECKFRAELVSSLDTSLYGHKTTSVVCELIDVYEFDKRKPEDVSAELHLEVPMNFGRTLFIHADKGAMMSECENGWFNTPFYIGSDCFELNVQFDGKWNVVDAYMKVWHDYEEYCDGDAEDLYFGRDDIKVITD